jgi:hypothetical protein
MINRLIERNPAFAIVSLLLFMGNPQRDGELPGARSAMQTAAISSERARSAYDFVNSIGVNTHLNYYDRDYGNFPFVERELESVGIRHVRDGIHFTGPGSNSDVYQRWAALGRDGVRFDGVLDPRNSLGSLTPAKLDQIEEITGGAIESFEGPNEMDVSKIADWAAVDSNYQGDVYRSAKLMRNANSVTVIGPSLASASNGFALGDIGDRVDYGNLHPYPAAKMPSAVLPDQMEKARVMFGGKKIVITETGYHNALHDHHDQPAVSEAAAAKYIPRLFLEDFSQGIVRTFLYELLDESPEPELADLQMHWGLIRSDGTEKPAFAAIKRMIGELSDSAEPAELQQLAYSIDPQSSQVHHLLLQKSDGEFDLILWQETPSYDYRDQRDIPVSPQDVTLTLSRKAHSIRTYEPAAKAEPLEVYSDVARVSLRVPDDPLVIQIAWQ